MENQELIEEIIRRVSERLAALGPAEGNDGAAADNRPGLLILAREHGADCHLLLESEAVQARYKTECALAKHYEVNLDDYEAVVLYGLSCGALAALASGIWDCAYTRLASQAILSGKRVYIPAEEVELYRYRDTAPAPYYKMLWQKFSLLMDEGAVVCANSELEQLLLCKGTQAGGAPAEAEECPPAPQAEAASPEEARKEARIEKRVLTERDLIAAQQAGAARILVTERCIITALAADTAAERGLTIVRDGE